MYNCPHCSKLVGDLWSSCEYCGNELVYKCPKCGNLNYYNELKCDCGYEKIISKVNKKSESDESKSKVLVVQCTTCNEEINIKLKKEFDVFFCRKCRAIYSVEVINNNTKVNLVKKGNIIPQEVLAQMKILNISKIEFSLEELKNAWKKQVDLYHPDKVNHLGDEIKNLAEEKTKKLNIAYSIIMEWKNYK